MIVMVVFVCVCVFVISSVVDKKEKSRQEE